MGGLYFICVSVLWISDRKSKILGVQTSDNSLANICISKSLLYCHWVYICLLDEIKPEGCIWSKVGFAGMASHFQVWYLWNMFILYDREMQGENIFLMFQILLYIYRTIWKYHYQSKNKYNKKIYNIQGYYLRCTERYCII